MKEDLLFREKQSLLFTWRSLKDAGIRKLPRLGGGKAQEQIFLSLEGFFCSETEPDPIAQAQLDTSV